MAGIWEGKGDDLEFGLRVSDSFDINRRGKGAAWLELSELNAVCHIGIPESRKRAKQSTHKEMQWKTVCRPYLRQPDMAFL